MGRFGPAAGRALGLVVLVWLAWQLWARGTELDRAGAALRFLHGVDLIIHEAGHTVFLFFGPYLSILGGSALQVLVPAVCAGYFLLHRQPASFAVALFWTGESITDVAIYVADAQKMALPLLGGHAVIHDWNYLLAPLRLVPYAGALGALTFALGMLVILGALAVLAWEVARAWPDAAEGHGA
ncbi:MAG TPA: hypothetical protein VFN71_12255 [Methylomirabilota bacterium]|nr:hypothetical protein [Methylomirabilota bacterium]